MGTIEAQAKTRRRNGCTVKNAQQKNKRRRRNSRTGRRRRHGAKMKSVKLGPYTIPIQRKEMVNAVGCWDSNKRIITIDPGLEGAAYWDTLIHECTHAISDLHWLNLTEAQVCTLGVGLAQALLPVIVED